MFPETQELEALIASVLEANDSRCLDDTTDRAMVTNAIVSALLHKAVLSLDAFKPMLQSEAKVIADTLLSKAVKNLDMLRFALQSDYVTRRVGYEDEGIVSMFDAAGMDIQQDQDGQYVVYTNVFQED